MDPVTDARSPSGSLATNAVTSAGEDWIHRFMTLRIALSLSRPAGRAAAQAAASAGAERLHPLTIPVEASPLSSAASEESMPKAAAGSCRAHASKMEFTVMTRAWPSGKLRAQLKTSILSAPLDAQAPATMLARWENDRLGGSCFTAMAAARGFSCAH